MSSERVSRNLRCTRSSYLSAGLANWIGGIRVARHAAQDLPVDALHVVVRAGRQLVTAAQAAALQDCPSVGGGHARAVAVHAHAPADLGLIRSLRHYMSSSLTQ